MGPLPISVVIPHHNRSELLRAAVASVYAQTLPPAELIVVDDASTPEHRDTLNTLPAGVRVVLLPESRGAAGARNAGIEVCTQPWISFLDDDDAWLPEKLERQWEVLQQDSSLSAVVCGMRVVSDERPPWNITSHSPQVMTLPAALEDNIAMLQTSVIRASELRTLGGFDGSLRIFEDQDFWIRFTAAGYRGFCLADPLVILNRRRIKRITTHWLGKIQAQFKLIAKHQSKLEAVHGRGAMRRARSRGVCRTGLEEGRIVGRMIYAYGCIAGGDFRRLAKLATTSRMEIIPYLTD